MVHTMAERRYGPYGGEVCTYRSSCVPWFSYGDSGLDGGFKFRPYPDELREMGPELSDVWEKFFMPAPDKPILWFGLLSQ